MIADRTSGWRYHGAQEIGYLPIKAEREFLTPNHPCLVTEPKSNPLESRPA
ncbi:MAG: hypothetical protein AB8B63_04580 [Granulosicoccus sp.]